MIKNVYWSSCKVSIYIVILYRNLSFIDRFSKHAKISNLMKNRPVGVELFHAETIFAILRKASKMNNWKWFLTGE
jgi:hypothetical protein